MAPSKWKCTHPNCGAIAKNEAGSIEHWGDYHFEEDYPGPTINKTASKASNKATPPVSLGPQLASVKHQSLLRPLERHALQSQ
ncbi:hypothetical protein ONS95_007484 [Cadophora gregata]|uniref:uncharacterized protein n=1 Tax=Cadophora gregata TaxID=51156 RepID=UPI0026DB536B|nr:uncharacterized protein ONS95_007484 [Cadophora gregata]KAK0125853.1 hypothetical protein ONS95_007484 [Cadophora gregata]